MDKKEYLVRQIQKTNKKNYENYVITRIIHSVDDSDVKFVTQQYVRRGQDANGRELYALTDLFLPQIRLHIEVDEGHHFVRAGREFKRISERGDIISGQQYVEADRIREADIVNATAHVIERVRTAGTLSDFNGRIDALIMLINEMLDAQRKAGTFRPWDPDKEQNPATYIKQGWINVEQDVSFRTHADACRCFGHSYTRYQRALARHPHEPDITIWFPKLYENEDWDNWISADDSIIWERRKSDNEAFIEQSLSKTGAHNRLVFAHVRSPLGDVMYRFIGRYEIDVEESRSKSTITYRRKAAQARTYSPTVA